MGSVGLIHCLSSRLLSLWISESCSIAHSARSGNNFSVLVFLEGDVLMMMVCGIVWGSNRLVNACASWVAGSRLGCMGLKSTFRIGRCYCLSILFKFCSSLCVAWSDMTACGFVIWFSALGLERCLFSRMVWVRVVVICIHSIVALVVCLMVFVACNCILRPSQGLPYAISFLVGVSGLLLPGLLPWWFCSIVLLWRSSVCWAIVVVWVVPFSLSNICTGLAKNSFALSLW